MHISARLSVAAAVAMVACTLGLASTASADSIAYVKDGNVFLSTTDGARQYQVTANGGYSDVSQADDGTMIALHGVRLHRLDRAGNITADFDTPVSDTRPPGMKAFWGPYDPAISPGGDKVAYTYYYVSNGTGPGCYPPTCFTVAHEGGTGYSYADRQTAWDDAARGRHSGWLHPSWIDNDTAMMSDPTHVPNQDVIIDTVGDGVVPLKDWFTDTGTKHISGGEMTRQRTKMAFAAGEGDTELRLYRVRTFPTQFPPPSGSNQYPEACYFYGNPVGGHFGTPTFSADGRKLAVAEGDGVHIADVPDFAAGCTQTGATLPALVIPGATEPDWGPADVPAARPEKKDDPNKDDPKKDDSKKTDPKNVGPVDPKLSSKLTVTVPPARLRAALARGLKLRVTVPGSGKLSASVRRGGRTLGTAAARTVKGPGTVTLTVRFGASARRALAHAKRPKLTVAVRFTRAGGSGTNAAASATLR